MRRLFMVLMLVPSLAFAVGSKITAGDAMVRTATRQVWMKVSKLDGGVPCSGLGLRCATGTDLAAAHRPNWWFTDFYVYLDCGTSECTGLESFTPGAMFTLIDRTYGSQYNDSWVYHLQTPNDPNGSMNTAIHAWLNGAPEPTFYLGSYSSDHVPFTGTCTTIIPPFYGGGVGSYIWHADISAACGIPFQAVHSKSYLRTIGGAPSGCKPECENVTEKPLPTEGSTWQNMKSLFR